MRMNIAGGIFILVGLCFGVAGVIAVFTSDGSLSCITSIMAMVGGVLLLQLAEQQKVATPIGDESQVTQ